MRKIISKKGRAEAHDALRPVARLVRALLRLAVDSRFRMPETHTPQNKNAHERAAGGGHSNVRRRMPSRRQLQTGRNIKSTKSQVLPSPDTEVNAQGGIARTY